MSCPRTLSKLASQPVAGSLPRLPDVRATASTWSAGVRTSMPEPGVSAAPSPRGLRVTSSGSPPTRALSREYGAVISQAPVLPHDAAEVIHRSEPRVVEIEPERR